jgi:DNA-binding beta-propeller fold protein YncE
LDVPSSAELRALDLRAPFAQDPPILRARALAFFVFVPLSALAVLVGACTEHFPSIPPATDAGALLGSALEAQAPAIVPPAQRLNSSSSPVVWDPVRYEVWVANGDVGTVSYVDVDEGSRGVIQEVAVGGSGADVRSVAVSPDGVWVAAVDRAQGNVVLMDAESREVRRSIPVGGHPRACVWDSANPRWLYVAVEDTGAVVVVDRTLGAVATSIDVGRIPAGLAVSATRREVYVTHRIDAELTVIDLGSRTVAAQVPLADEPFSAPSAPNGKPFGFDGLALRTDGYRAWIPHELLAPTHPFVFNQTLFPAISVVNLLDRVEQTTDPNSSNVDGRKNLFDAVNLIGPDAQPDVFSQFCAVAMHPQGYVAWALACASEDLVTFDVDHGVATDALRNLRGDHPVGMALDDTGARLFVMSDQSHTLVTLDTADGQLTGHTVPYGDPIPLVAKDPVVAQLRAGLTLFFRANSSKGTLPTTRNDWMSCGGCHLDGFTSTNLRLFESLQPSAPASDAQIGHVGLVDNFSTASTASINPHDILVALVDQGGLAPDRTGNSRTGAVEPSCTNCTDAITMARQLASVIARDLPQGPTWETAQGGPNTAWDTSYVAWDTSYCGSSSCHPTEYAEWSASVHAHAAADPMVDFCVGREVDLQGQQYPRLCAGCHDPVSARLGDLTMKSKRGITCLGCHDVDREIRAGGNGDLHATTHADWTADHKARALASLDTLRQPQFCGGCHRQFVPGTGLLALSTLDEYQSGPYAGVELCVDCHMRQNTAGHHDHRFPGGNVYLGQVVIGDSALVAEQTTNLQLLATLSPTRVAGGVLVGVSTVAGHAFPTGVADIREPWVELQAKDANGNVLAHFGGPDATGLIPPTAARLGIDIADSQGHVLLDHELSATTRIPFDVRVPAGEAQALFVPLPDTLPGGMASLDAVLYYRNVRTTYYRDATRDANGAAPTVELKRVSVPWP